MKRINIGHVHIPLDSYVIGGTALLGIRESGKTVAAKGIAEQLLDYGIPIVVFDAIGVWRHVKVAGDGPQAKGYQVVVAGGAQPDLTLTPNTAEQIVRAAIKENIPLIIDLYDAKLSKTDWRQIVQRCFRVLLYENVGLRHVFLEETAEYAPQKVTDGVTYAEVEKLVRMGGNKSLGITLISQRAQEVNKAVLDQCENVVLGRQRGAKAIENLQKWTERLDPETSKRIAADMPNMKAGEFWVFTSESDGATFTKTALPRSFHPDRRKPQAIEGRKIADTKQFVSRMEADLQQIIEERKANDPAELKKKIRELEKKLQNNVQPLDHAIAIAEEVSEATAPLVRRIDQLELVITQTQGIAESLGSAATQMQENILTIGELCQQLSAILRIENLAVRNKVTPKHQPVEAIGNPAAAASGSKRAPMAEPGASTNGELGKGEWKVLDALAHFPNGKSHNELAFLAGYSASASTLGVILSKLRKAGLVHAGQPIRLTDEGIEAAGGPKPQLRGQALIDLWMQHPRMGSGERLVMDTLIKWYPESLSAGVLCEITGYSPTASTLGVILSKLRKLGLVAKGQRRMSDEFMKAVGE